MFKDAKIFSSFSVDDVKNVKNFYKDILGLNVKDDGEMEMLTLKFADGGKVMIYPKGSAHKPATFTVLNIEVDNLEKAVDKLIEKGQKFEQYDDMYLKTDEKGIHRGNGYGPDNAWIADPAGNIIAILQS